MKKKLYVVLFMIISLAIFSSCDSTKIANNEVKNIVPEDTLKSKKTKHDPSKYPRVDGSTANMPMMAQIRADYLGEDLTTAENYVDVTTTDYAWRNLIDGKCDLLLVYEPSSETKDIIEKSPVKLKISPIGNDALVFITNENNTVSNLTKNQIQDIYQGKITNWKDVGGADEKIEAYQRELNSGSQTLFLNLVMKGLVPIQAPEKYAIHGMEALIKELATYNNSGNALGYSVFYYAKKMYEVPGLKLLSVDDIMPSDETIASGQYPYLNEYYVVIREDEPMDSETSSLYRFIMSDEGIESMKKAGYIPIENTK